MEADMVLSTERKPAALAPWQVPATLASAVVAVGLVAGWSAPNSGALTPAPDRTVATERCTQGDDVSNFVCRNTWMAHHKRSYR
jgi:hypothetical protein